MLGKLGQLQGGMPKGFDLKQLNENALRGAAGPGQAQQLDPRAQLQQMVQDLEKNLKAEMKQNPELKSAMAQALGVDESQLDQMNGAQLLQGLNKLAQEGKLEGLLKKGGDEDGEISDEGKGVLAAAKGILPLIGAMGGQQAQAMNPMNNLQDNFQIGV